MTLFGYLSAVAAVGALLYLWKRPVGVVAMLLALVLPGMLYLWVGVPLRTFCWSWVLPLAAGECLLIPLFRFAYVRFSRSANGYSDLTLEIEDSDGHLHYVKGINQGTYINGGSGSGKTASCNRAYAVHAARFGMPVLIHDLKRYELSETLYPVFRDAGIPYRVFALFDPERSVRVNPIAPRYLPDEASLRARVRSFLLAVQGRESDGSTADFFNNAASSLLESLIWYLKKYAPDYCHLPFVMSILNSPDNLHGTVNGRRKLFGKLENMLKSDPQVYSMAAAFFQGAGNVDTTGNILQTSILALNTVNTDAGFYLLSDNEIDLRINAPGNRVAFALVNDPKNSTAYAPILAMIADAALTMMSERGGMPAGALLDEAPELPVLRMQNFMATLRSLGIWIVYTTQDLSQIQRTQGGKEYNQRTVLSNMAHQFLGRTSLEQTAKYYEGLMPQVEKTERSYSSSPGGTTTTRRTVKKPRYERTEFYNLRQGEFVYFHGRVERFRFKYESPACELPPVVRPMDAAGMHKVAADIRQAAADFMNRFNR
ncbi:MAG: type IV secretory system conjugative DNA transfer family protein [Alistipes senegalensis]|nr:type IV secretory system conjugative DNA transfer family protein [Bacteroides cellulosilyticus]MCM1351297.1 type IV secretory system conjugative DNA transfer family protein [Alistipes senegalensis]